MGNQNKLFRLILNSNFVYLDGKTIKDRNALEPEIHIEKWDTLDEDYEIIFYDKKEGILKLEKYDKNKKTLYTLGGLSPEQLETLKK